MSMAEALNRAASGQPPHVSKNWDIHPTGALVCMRFSAVDDVPGTILDRWYTYRMWGSSETTAVVAHVYA
jgi:hypothetical protein